MFNILIFAPRSPNALPYSEKKWINPLKSQWIANHSPWFKPWAMME
jgi:hypothetical protein